MTFNIPVGGNKKLAAIVKLVDQDAEINAYWRCANVTAINRMGFSDHGPTHVKIVANIALKLLRMLVAKDVTPSIVKDYKLDDEDAEVVVMLAVLFHDVGMAVHRAGHDEFGVMIAFRLMDRLLEGIYDPATKPVIISEALHAIYLHDHTSGAQVLTLEAGIVRVADALDMSGGRARIPFDAGSVNIHSVSALAIRSVDIGEGKGKEKPIVIKINMDNSAGIFQIDELLRPRIKGSPMEPYITIIGEIAEKQEKKIVERIEI